VARALPGLSGMVAFTVVFIVAAGAMRSPELQEITGAMKRRLRRRGEAT
jgi:hypothetical protein